MKSKYNVQLRITNSAGFGNRTKKIASDQARFELITNTYSAVPGLTEWFAANPT